MRIQYTYQKYPNCPRATEYSRYREEATASASGLIGLVTIVVAIAFIYYTFSFFGNYNWNEYLVAVACAVGMALLDFNFIMLRPNNTACEIKVILVEASGDLSKNEKQKACEALRKENKIKNRSEIIGFFPVLIVSLMGVTALIAAIKAVYFLCHREGGGGLLLGALAAMAILAYLVWRLVYRPASKPAANTAVVDRASPARNSEQSESNDIAFCRMCGAKLLSDSVFCAKCGTKVR